VHRRLQHGDALHADDGSGGVVESIWAHSNYQTGQGALDTMSAAPRPRKIQRRRGAIMWSDIGYYATLGVESVIGIFGIRMYEEPRYEVVARIEDRVEIRQYMPRLAAEVALAGEGKEKSSEAFGLLFAYISGANQASDSGGGKIAMTVPVETRGSEKLAMTAPVQVAESKDAVRMLFYLPAEMRAETAPKPTDGRVRVVTVPGATIATLRFSGSTDVTGARQAELVEILKQSRWHPTGAPYLLSYDPPFTLPFLRRNEAAVGVAQTP
jgi:hypothetical protein